MAGAVGKRQVVADDVPPTRIKVEKMAVAGSPSQTSTTAPRGSSDPDPTDRLYGNAPSGSSDPDPTDRPCGIASAQADAGGAPGAANPAAKVASQRASKRGSWRGTPSCGI